MRVNEQKITYIGEKIRQKCLKINNKTITKFLFDILQRGRWNEGVVVDKDQCTSTSLISIPALSELCRAKVGFSEYSFFDVNVKFYTFPEGVEKTHFQI